MNSGNEDEVILYDLVSVPSETAAERGEAATRWLHEDSSSADRSADASSAETRAAMHPISGKVAGFAAGRLQVTGTSVRIDDLQASIGDERSALMLADRAVARMPGHRVTYSARQWAARFVIARTFLCGLPSRATIGGVARNVINLADVIALGDLVAAPPLHLVAQQLRLPERYRPATMPELVTAVRTGSHARLLVEMVGRIRTLAWLWTAMYLGPEFEVAPLDLRAPRWNQPTADESQA